MIRGKEEEKMKKDTTYIGRIGNSGAMKTEAPLQVKKKKKGKVITGDDLRNGK